MENLNYLKIYVDRLYILMRTFDHDLLIDKGVGVIQYWSYCILLDSWKCIIIKELLMGVEIITYK